MTDVAVSSGVMWSAAEFVVVRRTGALVAILRRRFALELLSTLSSETSVCFRLWLLSIIMRVKRPLQT